MTRSNGSLYPIAHPPKSRVLVHTPPDALSPVDRALVMLSSLLIVGSPVWVPTCYAWAWNKWRQIPKADKKRRTAYATILLSLVALAALGPHRSPKFGNKWLQARKWRLWAAWLKFVAFEVVVDKANESSFDVRKEQAIFAVIPHGIFPFALALAALPQGAVRVFGEFRPVVATATALFPFVRTLLSWIRAVDASRSAVDEALANGSRIGLAPGGIAEMFEGYPKPLTHPDDEYAILQPRKGFVRMAVKHSVPVIPIYCFGATKMLKRVQLPAFFENVSKLLRVSLCLFFGRWGLPLPFRQRLLYVMGRPIFPPHMVEGTIMPPMEGNPEFDRQVDDMHARFCDELIELFDRHKESYGWNRKTLQLV